MELFRNQQANQLSEVSLTNMIARKAWYLLNGFGFEDESTDKIITAHDFFLGTAKYLDIESPEVYIGDNEEYGIHFNQYPIINGKRQRDPGWVALHVCEYDDYDVQLTAQQLAFRLETHKDGSAVFVNNGAISEQIVDADQLRAVLGHLSMLENILWDIDHSDMNERPKKYPLVTLSEEDLKLVELASDEE